MFAFILMYPVAPLRFFFIPIDIPAVVIGGGYLWYSHYLATKGSNDNVNHEAHYMGGIWGVVFMLLLDKDLILIFFIQVLDWLKSLT